MASIELTFEQILEAAQQLPGPQQRSLVEALASPPSAYEIQKAARQIRPAFRLGPKKRKRMSILTAKRSAGALTAAERAELDRLVDEITENSLRMAEAVGNAVSLTARRRSAN